MTNVRLLVFSVLLYWVNGEFLPMPMQLIYGGKTRRCLPPFNFPGDWSIVHTENHWSNETTYIEDIIAPYVKVKREQLGDVGKDARDIRSF